MSVPYRAPPSVSNSTDRWAGARIGLSLFAVVAVVRALACFLEWEGLRTDAICVPAADVTLPRSGLASIAMLAYAAVACVAPVGALAFRRSLRSRRLRGLTLAAALLLGIEAVGGLVLALRRTADAPVPGWLPAVVTTSAALGALGFLASAWRVAHVLRARTTGWTWALAGALVVSIASWHLRASAASTSLGTYAYFVRRSPYSLLVSYAVVAASLLALALPCLRLRRRLVGALPEEPPALPGVIQTVQLHAASLEGKLALMIGLAALECASRVPWLDIRYGWGPLFAFGDAALDVLALVTILRSTRETGAQSWLVGSIMLRLPFLVLAARDYATWPVMLVFALPGDIFALVGHHGFVRRIVAKLEPYCLGRTQAAYREATWAVVVALCGLVAIGFIARSTPSFIVMGGPTAIISVGILRRHVRAALALIAEGEQADSTF